MQPKWAADGKYPVAYLHAFRVPQFRDRQGMVDVNFDNGQISFLVGTDNFGIVLNPRWIVLQPYAHSVCLLHHVPVGNDVSLGIDNHA